MIEDEMVGWFHRLNGDDFNQDGEGQGLLVCCSHGVTKSWTRLSYRRATTKILVRVRITQPNLQIQFDFYEHFNGISSQKWGKKKLLLKAF